MIFLFVCLFNGWVGRAWLGLWGLPTGEAEEQSPRCDVPKGIQKLLRQALKPPNLNDVRGSPGPSELRWAE